MDRRMLVIAGIAAATLAGTGCGEDNTPPTAQAVSADEVEATITPRAQGTDRSDAAQRCDSSHANRCDVAVDQSAKDKTLYFNRSDASQR